MAVINIIRISELEFHNRIDGELYNPIFKKSFTQIKEGHLGYERLKNICIIRSGTTPVDRNDDLREGPILFKTTDIRNEVLSPDESYYHISEKIHKRMAGTQLHDSDVLLNIVGATLDVIGRSAYWTNFEIPANITQAMVMLRIKKPNFLPGYLFSFLNTKYGQDQVRRYARPTGQYNLNLSEVGAIIIPCAEVKTQQEIHELVVQSGAKLREASRLYVHANKLLKKSLGLDELEIENSKSYTASFSEIIYSHRLDSQHYKPKYDQLIKHLKANFECFKIGNIEAYNRRGAQPIYVDDGTIDIINSEHVGETHVDYDKLERTTEGEFNNHPEAHVYMGDILIYTTGAYIGRTSVYLKDKPALASNHVNILRLKGDIDTGYLALLMNSIVGKFQTEKYQRGSAQAELYPHDISKYIVPVLVRHKMTEIGDLVRKSLTAKDESKILLKNARQRVEQLIEEAAAKQN